MLSWRAERKFFALPLLDDVKIFHQFITDVGMILTLRNEEKLKVLENGVLVRKFGPKTAEVHNDELHNLYSSYYFGIPNDKGEMGGA
jgi:hypothetical protein